MKRDYKEFNPTLSDKESKGRFDIKYRTNGGLHILVELKKANRKMHLPELLEQGQTYVSALKKCLKVSGEPNASAIALVFVLGKTVHEADNVALGAQYVAESLRPLGARIVYYEELIKGATNSYEEYLNQSREADRVEDIVVKLDRESKALASKAKAKKK